MTCGTCETHGTGMTLRTIIAVASSLSVHGLLAFAFVAYLECVSGPDVLATLDLSCVELSFAEQVDESAAVVQSLPSPPVHVLPKPSKDEGPPEVEQAPPLPRSGEIRFSEPKEDVRLPAKVEKSIQQLQVNQTIKRPASSPAAPQQARVDAPPQPWRAIRPVYPKRAQRRGEQGEVELEIDVTADGTVAAVSVVQSSGYADLDEAAVRAVRAATFRPARTGSEAVRSIVRQKLEFRLK